MPLDASMVAPLRRHRTAQTAEKLAARQWTDHGLAFTNETGALADPRSVLRVLQDAASKLGTRDA